MLLAVRRLGMHRLGPGAGCCVAGRERRMGRARGTRARLRRPAGGTRARGGRAVLAPRWAPRPPIAAQPAAAIFAVKLNYKGMHGTMIYTLRVSFEKRPWRHHRHIS